MAPGTVVVVIGFAGALQSGASRRLKACGSGDCETPVTERMEHDTHAVLDLDPPAELVAALRALRAPIIIAHVRPDADALGSMFAACRACVAAGGRARVSLPDGSLSQRLGFMADWAECEVASERDFAAAAGFLVVDTAGKNRCNLPAALKEGDWSARRRVMNIDHHTSNTMFGDVNWVVETGSASELVYRALKAADWPIDSVTASMLYAGIYSDTIGFSLPSTTAAALHAAGELVALGADVARIGHRLSRSLTASEYGLLRVIYDNTHRAADGQITYSWATFEEITGAGCTAADIDDQIAVPRSLIGTRLAMLFTEGVRGQTRINFRGGDDVTVLELAKRFGGGGHARAAGAIIEGPVERVRDRVLVAAEAYLKGGPQ
jgi:phosphoesterase RecJ-like protein